MRCSCALGRLVPRGVFFFFFFPAILRELLSQIHRTELPKNAPMRRMTPALCLNRALWGLATEIYIYIRLPIAFFQGDRQVSISKRTILKR